MSERETAEALSRRIGRARPELRGQGLLAQLRAVITEAVPELPVTDGSDLTAWVSGSASAIKTLSAELAESGVGWLPTGWALDVTSLSRVDAWWDDHVLLIEIGYGRELLEIFTYALDVSVSVSTAEAFWVLWCHDGWEPEAARDVARLL